MCLCLKSWNAGEIPGNYEEVNVVPVFQKSKQNDLSNYRAIILTLIPGKIMKWLMLGLIHKELKEDNVIDVNQCEFKKKLILS